MNAKLNRYEPWLYAGALLLAASLRLINLGSLPLSDTEAVEALKALGLFGGSASTSGQPLYTLITAGLFAIFGNSDFLARLLPALTGCLLLLLPWYLRDDLGKLTALVLAFGLALDPALVALSRQAGSVMPALCFTLLALCALWKRQARLAGFFGGLAMLSGVSFWYGLTGLLLVWLVMLLFRKNSSTADPLTAETEVKPWSGVDIKKAGFAFVVTIILGGSLFLTLPAGMNMLVSGFLDFLRGWYTTRGVTIERVLVALVIYQFGILFLGLTEGISGWIQKVTTHRNLVIAFLAFLFLLIIYPGRQMGDAGWCVVCLWILAAGLLSRLENTPREVAFPIIGHALLVVALILFVILNISFVMGGYGGLDWIRSLAILGGLVIIIIISLLVGFGWGIDVAIRGAFAGVGSILLAVMISLGVSAGGLNARSSPDLWGQNQRVVGADTLLEDLDHFSRWDTGEADNLTIEVVRFDTASLRWSLRRFQNVSYVNGLIPKQMPDIIITDFNLQPELAKTYRGESFAWYKTADWSSMEAFSLLEWIFHREMYESPVNLILWVRSDIFVSGNQSYNTMDTNDID
jgi:hypothetical protein